MDGGEISGECSSFRVLVSLGVSVADGEISGGC